MTLINPELSSKSIFEEYNDTGMVVIKDFLLPDFAEELYQELNNLTEWELLTFGAGGQSVYTPEQFTTLSFQQQQSLIPSHTPHYTGQFSYAYQRYLISAAVLEGRASPALSKFFYGSNNAEYFKFFSTGKGLDAASHLDVNASLYAKGHYLSCHNDYDAASKRTAGLAAHVIGLTKNWKKEWGGLLTFCDNWGQIKLQRQPSFNSLVLFDIPVWHYVSEVSQKAEEPRYSIYGWMKEGAKAVKLESSNISYSHSYTL